MSQRHFDKIIIEYPDEDYSPIIVIEREMAYLRELRVNLIYYDTDEDSIILLLGDKDFKVQGTRVIRNWTCEDYITMLGELYGYG